MILPTLRGAVIMAAALTLKSDSPNTLTRVLLTRATAQIGA